MRHRLSILFLLAAGAGTVLGQPAPDALVAHPLAYSEKLGLRYFVVARKHPENLWCAPAVLVRIEADPAKFVADAGFNAMTQRAGAILENRCARAESALIYVMDPANPGAKPLWAGRFARASSWAPVPVQAKRTCAAGDLDCEPAAEAQSAQQAAPAAPPAPRPLAAAQGQALPQSPAESRATGAAPPPAAASAPPLATRPLTSPPPAAAPASAPAAPRGKSFARQSLVRKNFENENLRNASFEGADLESANFHGAFIENGNFRGANIVRTNFRNANLSGADFTGAKFDFDKAGVWVNAKLVGAVMPDFEFKLVGCVGYYSKNHYELGSQRTVAMITDFTNGELSFRNATLTNGTICGDMTGVDFRGADLRGADLSKTTELAKALLGGAKYDGRTRLPVDPGAFRMVRAPDAPRPAGRMIGEWWIDKERPGEKPTANLGYLALDANGEFEWSPGDQDGKSIFGAWTRGGGDGLLLRAGEAARDWTLKLSSDPSGKEDVLEITSADGALKRTAFRKTPQKKE